MDTKVTVRSGPMVTLLKISMSGAVHQTGVSPKGLLTFGLIRPNKVKDWQGQDATSVELLSFGSSDPFDGVSTTQFSGTTISAKEQDVELLADTLGLNVPDSLRTSTKPEVFGERNRLSVIHLKSDLLTGDCTAPMTAEVEEDIIANLLLAVNPDENCEDMSSTRTRSRAVSMATDLMQAYLGENIPISRICHETGASWRTLDRAFSEKFGFGPKRYYLRLRLNRVRSDLIRNTDQNSISDIANSWGFWHLGQTAKDFYNMFGELPSDTNTSHAHAPI